MQVYGNIATPVEKRVSKSGKEFYVFRMAENHGKEEDRTTTWYDVSAFISELDADLLSKGQFVKVSGKLTLNAYLKRNGEPGASLSLLTSSIEAVERKPRPADGQGQSQGGSRGGYDDDMS